MKHKIKIPETLCTYEDIAQLPLIPPTRLKALKASDSGLFPAYHRLVSAYAEPCWFRADIMRWLKDRFGKLLPDVIREIELSGELVPAPRPKMRRSMIRGVVAK